MDDQRPQNKWELRKQWVEDPSRTHGIQEGINSFSGEKTFVKRHGDGKSLCYFETIDKFLYRSLQPCAKAAFDLATVFQGAVLKACRLIPLELLTVKRESIAFPSSALAPESSDYCPLLISGTLENGKELPKWLEFNTALGHLRAARGMEAAVGDTHLKIRFQFSVKMTTDFSCTISSSLPERGVDALVQGCRARGREVQRLHARHRPTAAGRFAGSTFENLRFQKTFAARRLLEAMHGHPGALSPHV
jgi:hypothetical protein